MALYACEAEKYEVPDISETPVYQILNHDEDGGLQYKVNIYKDVDIVISSQGPTARESIITERLDFSDEENYNITTTSEEIRDETRTVEVQAIDDDGELVWEDENETIPVMVDLAIPVIGSYTFVHEIMSGDNEKEHGTLKVTTTGTVTSASEEYEYEEAFDSTHGPENVSIKETYTFI